MFDVISILAWGITYILIVFSCKKQEGVPKRAIPLVPPLLNLSWELVALVHSQAFWGHIVWFGLSILVFDSCLMSITNLKKQLFYALLLGPIAILFSLIFMYGGMLVSSFAINVIMSICYWMDRRNLLEKRKILIATTKCIGTLAATIHYAPYSTGVAIMGIVIVVFDLMYLVFCIRENKDSKEKNKASLLFLI